MRRLPSISDHGRLRIKASQRQDPVKIDRTSGSYEYEYNKIRTFAWGPPLRDTQKPERGRIWGFSDGLAGETPVRSKGLKTRLFLGRLSRVAGFARLSWISFQTPLDQAFSYRDYLPCHFIFATV